MNLFPTSSLIYIFAGTTCLVYAYHYWRTFRQTNNEYSKMFFQLGIWVAIGMYLYGVPNLIYPSPHILKGVFWVLGSWSIFFGINKPLQVALVSWDKTSTAKFAKIFTPATAGALAVLTLFNLVPPNIDNYGIIYWNINYPFDILWFASGIAITLIPAIFLFTAKTKSRKAAIKKTLFSITFLFGGLGGWSTVLFQNIIWLAISFIVFFFGFLALAVMIIVEVVMKEPFNISDNN